MEENNDARGYAKLNKIKTKRRENGFHPNSAFANIPPPMDIYNAVYAAFVLGGVGFLLPYNSFIMASDYFKVRYPSTPVVFDMSLVYIVVAFITVLGNNLLVETFTLNVRINFGYLMSFVTLLFVVICEVWWEAFGTATSYSVNLIAVAVVAIGCTVQQSSFYGYTSMLPARYTQAVMVGESVSGVFTSSVRVLTRVLVNNLRGSTVYFFTVSISAVATCFIMYHLIRRTDFIQFYIALCERAKTKITLEPTEDAGLIEPSDAQYGVLKIRNSPPTTTTETTEIALSFANPAYEPSAPLPAVHTYKVEDVVIRGGRQSISTGGNLSSMKRGLQARWEITKAIYPYMISICLVYFATLCLYPGIASEIINCRLGDWMAILMMALFNGADLVGKMLASNSKYWTGGRLVRCSVLRLIMIPLMIMCVLPRTSPIFQSELTAFTFALILGFTNGILGSVPMIQAPSKVEDSNRELTGNLMTLLYNFGLTTGSLMAYFLESVINPIRYVCCPPEDAISSNISTTVATIAYHNTTLFTTVINLMSPAALMTTTSSGDNLTELHH